MLKLDSKKINDDMEYVEIKDVEGNVLVMQTGNNIHIIKYKNEEELKVRLLEKIKREGELLKELKELEIENEILQDEVDCLYEELDEYSEGEFYDVDYTECEHSKDCIICEEIRKLREEKEKENDEI